MEIYRLLPASLFFACLLTSVNAISDGELNLADVSRRKNPAVREVSAEMLNDVWAYYVDENRWEKIEPGGVVPPPTKSHAAVYDPLNQRMVVSGGLMWDVYQLSLEKGSETWSEAYPSSGDFSKNLWGTEIFYSPSRKSLIAPNIPDQKLDIWNLQTDHGTTVDLPHGPEKRYFIPMILDEKRQRILIYGGFITDKVFNDVWELDITPGSERWKQLPRKGDAPPPKHLLRGCLDPVRDKFIMYGGNSHNTWRDGDYADTTYEMHLTSDTWQLVPTITPPSARGQYGVAWDDLTRQMYVMCGLYRVGPELENVITYNEIWVFDGDTQSWYQQIPPEPHPKIRRMATTVFDEKNRRIILFGGECTRPVIQVKAAIKIPRNGRKISGNRVTVMAELIEGSINLVRDITFQYRRPSVTGKWANISAAGNNHPNPDEDFPYFIHWDVSEMPDGEVDIRAVATDVDNVSDPAPVDITVEVDHHNPHTTQTIQSNGHIRLDYRIDKCALADFGVSDDAMSEEYKNARNANVRIRIPGGALTTGTMVTAAFDDPGALSRLEPDNESIGYILDLSMDGKHEKIPPGQYVTLMFDYPDNDREGWVDHTSIHENTLSIYVVEESGKMTELEDVRVNADDNCITGRSSRFSMFTIRGTPDPVVTGWMLYGEQ